MRRVLATPGVAALVAAALVARLPSTMVGLALVLFVRQRTGAFGAAGAVAAAYTAGIAVTSPRRRSAASSGGSGRCCRRRAPARRLTPGA